MNALGLRRRRDGLRCWAACLVGALVVCFGQTARADDASGADAAAPARAETPGPAAFQFRRVFAPADRVADWPCGADKYIPIDAAEFERLAKMLQDGGQASKLMAARLVAATYAARIGEDDVLTGAFEWQVAHQSDRRAILPLDPTSFAIDGAAWGIDSRGGSDGASRAGDTVGSTGTNAPAGPSPDSAAGAARATPESGAGHGARAVLGAGPDGRLGLLVDRAGAVNGRWWQRGDRTAGGSMSYAIDLPPAACSRLIVDLPEKMTAAVDHGIAYEASPGEATTIPTAPDAAKGAEPPGPPPGHRRWIVDVGGETRIRFRALAEGASQERRRLTLLRENLTYELTKRGVDLSASLRLDIHNEPLKRVFANLDPGLQVLAARIGDVDVPWSLVERSAPGKTRVLFELPEPIMGAGRVLRIAAEAPLPLGDELRLPRLNFEDMFWQEGAAQLVVPRPLALERLTLVGCRQIGVVPTAGSSPGETLELQYYGADAAVDVMVDQPEQRLTAECGTLVNMSAAEMSAQAIAQLRLVEGECFEVRAEVGKQWLIDTVESNVDNVADWSIVPVGDGAAELVVRLKRAVSLRRAVTLHLRGRRATTVGEKLSGAELLMARFRRTGGAQLLAIRAAEDYDLQTINADELTRRDAAKLDTAQAALFPEAPTGAIYVVDDNLARLQVSLTTRRPSYAGEIAIDAAVEDRSLRETFLIRCQPQESRVDRVRVHFSQPRKQSLHWTLVGGAAGQITAHQLPAGADPQRLVGGETWEVNLRLPRPGPFEIRAVRTVPVTSQTPIVLASLPEAASQQGSVAVRAIGETGVLVHNRRLKPIPPELLPPDRAQTARGSFRYEPAREVVAAEPAVSLSLTPDNQPHSGAWAWNCSLDSRYAVGAAANHLAVLQIQTGGRRNFRCTLPADATLRDAWIDERQLPASALDDGAAGLRIDLPPGRAFVTVLLHYSTLEALPTLSTGLRAPLPAFDIPVLEQRWVAWTPPGYSLMESDPSWQSDPARGRSWSQRLFGPLGRPARQQIFNPLAAEMWRQSADRLQPGGGQGAVIDRALAAVASLGALDRASRSEKLSWQKLLGRWKAMEPAAGFALLVDAPSLSLLGVAPLGAAGQAGGPAPPTIAEGTSTATDAAPRPDAGVFAKGASTVASVGPDDYSHGAALLDRANLTLIVRDDKLLLTTAVAAATYREQLLAPEPGVVAALASGPLADELNAATAGRSRRFVNLEVWSASVALDRLPWTAPVALAEDLTGCRGWTAWPVNLTDSGPPVVRVVRMAAMQICGWGVALAILACGAQFRSRRAAPWIVAAGALGAFAMLAPPDWTLILAPALLASLAYLTLLFTGRLALVWLPGDRGSRAVAWLLQPQFVTAIALSMAAAFYGACCWAADVSPGARGETSPRAEIFGRADAASGDSATKETAKTPAARSPVYTVFVPIDDDRRPTGGKYSIPERMYDEMYAAAAVATNRPGAWLLAGAEYRGALLRDAAQRRLALSELKGVFDLRVFAPNATIRLPIDRDRAAVEPDGVRLDGEPVHGEWDPAHGALVFQVADPGQYRLELNLLPTAPSHSGGIEIAIPPLATASVELSSPGDGPSIEIASARGPTHFSRDQGIVFGRLGPTGRLAARWREEAGVDGPTSNVEADELAWAHVRPGGVTLDARLRLRVSEGRLRQVRLLADPRLRLLPPSGETTLIAETHVSPGDPQTFDLELARPVTDQVTLDLRFLLTAASGVGNVRLPRLEVVGARSTRRWMGLSVDPALAFEEQPGGEARPLAVPDFATAWGATGDSRPSAAYNVPRGEAPLVIATRPREPRATIEQTLSVGFGPGRATVVYEAAIQTFTAANFQLALDAPADLRVERVALAADGLQRVTRWSQDPAGRVTVFMNGPVSGAQQLELRGVMPLPPEGVVPLPVITLPAAELKRSHYYIYRSPALLVDVEDQGGLTFESDDELPPNPELGSPVRACAAQGTAPRGAIKLRVNAPQTHAALAILVQRENDAWMAEADLRLNVAEGVLDMIRLEIPPQWNEPFQLDPPQAHDVVAIAGEKRRQLRIRPASAVKDHLRVRVRGRLSLPGSERLRAPDIAAPWIGRLERYVVLPTQLELQQVEWETVGLRGVALPPEFAGRLPALDAVAAYQVVSEPFQAVLKSVERMAGAPQVRMADIHAAWRTDGSCYGVAAFDIEPAGVGGCVLSAPAPLELLGVVVGGMPAPLEPAGLHRWRVSFASRQLPQHIEAVFHGRLAAGALETGSIRLEAPNVADLVVERTLWTVHAPAPMAAAEVVGNPTALTPADAELWRMKSAAALLDVAPEVVADQHSDEIVRWYRPWQKQIERSGALIRREQQLLGARRTAEQETEARGIEREQVNVAQRFGVASAKRGEQTAPSRPAELFSALRFDDRPTVFALAGPASAVSLRYPQAPAHNWSSRMLAAVGLVAISLAGLWLLGRVRLKTISLASGMAIVGLIWWLLLNPSPVGLAIATAGGMWRARRWLEKEKDGADLD